MLLLPIIILTLLLLNNLLLVRLRFRTAWRSTRRATCSSADQIIARVAVRYALLVVRAARLGGLQCVCLSIGGFDCGLALGKVGCGCGLGAFGGLGGGCGLLGGGGLFVVGVGVGGPVDLLFVCRCGR